MELCNPPFLLTFRLVRRQSRVKIVEARELEGDFLVGVQELVEIVEVEILVDRCAIAGHFVVVVVEAVTSGSRLRGVPASNDISHLNVAAIALQLRRVVARVNEPLAI